LLYLNVWERQKVTRHFGVDSAPRQTVAEEVAEFREINQRRAAEGASFDVIWVE
jgi:hypothetical protein